MSKGDIYVRKRRSGLDMGHPDFGRFYILLKKDGAPTWKTVSVSSREDGVSMPVICGLSTQSPNVKKVELSVVEDQTNTATYASVKSIQEKIINYAGEITDEWITDAFGQNISTKKKTSNPQELRY